MNKLVQSVAMWCGRHKKFSFIVLSFALLNLSCLMARSSYVPTIRVRAIDVDTRRPIEDAVITVSYHTGILNAATKVLDSRITNANGEAEFPARMIWAYWFLPDVYTDAKVRLKHYYYVMESITPAVVHHPRYFSRPVQVEAVGKHIDNLRGEWEGLLYTNLEVTAQIMPIYYATSNSGPRENPRQILAHYENTFNRYSKTGINVLAEMRYRNKIAELKNGRYFND